MTAAADPAADPTADSAADRTAATTAGPPIGLRERKKQRTRTHIAAVATRLFVEQGFSATTIADVARVAGVAKMTVTNYFPLKEDLVFDRAGEIVTMPGRAVADRPAGMSIVDAIRRVYAEQLALRNPVLGYLGRPFAEMVDASPALRARERAMFDEQETALAAVLADELGGEAAAADPLAPRVAAAQLSAMLRVLYYEGRRRLLAGEDTERIVAGLARAAEEGFGRLVNGWGPQLAAPGG